MRTLAIPSHRCHSACLSIFLTYSGWLGSRVVSVLDWGAERPGFKSQSRRCWVTVLGKLFTLIVPVYQAAELVAALLRVARVTAGLAESNGSLPPGLWLSSPAGWLPRTGISLGTLRLAIEYGLPLPFYLAYSATKMIVITRVNGKNWVFRRQENMSMPYVWINTIASIKKWNRTSPTAESRFITQAVRPPTVFHAHFVFF